MSTLHGNATKRIPKIIFMIWLLSWKHDAFNCFNVQLTKKTHAITTHRNVLKCLLFYHFYRLAIVWQSGDTARMSRSVNYISKTRYIYCDKFIEWGKKQKRKCDIALLGILLKFQTDAFPHSAFLRLPIKKYASKIKYILVE